MRDTVRDAFTPSRLGLVSWASAAIFMGTIGLASYKFGTPSSGPTGSSATVASLRLPPAGDVTSTASIGGSRTSTGVEILQMKPANSDRAASGALEQSQIAVLQEQIVRLRRRMSALSEQNATYSRRLAALERPGSKSEHPTVPVDPAPEVKRPKELPPLADGNTALPKRIAAPLKKPTKSLQSARAPADPLRDTQPEADIADVSASHSKYSVPRRISLHTGQVPQKNIPSYATEPVRMVSLPQDSMPPETTASINPEARTAPAPTFDSTPTSTVGKPQLIEPSSAVGRLHGSGQSILKNTDFGAVVGHYQTVAQAANAWSRFREQNEERMRGLRPLISEAKDTGGPITLLVGPFGNAVDAASACFQLLEVTEFCRPALYAGDPLVSAAKFPDTAFQ